MMPTNLGWLMSRMKSRKKRPIHHKTVDGWELQAIVPVQSYHRRGMMETFSSLHSSSFLLSTLLKLLKRINTNGYLQLLNT